MSRLNARSESNAGLRGMMNRINALQREAGSAFASPETTKQLCSMESLNDGEMDRLTRHADDIQSQLKNIYADCYGAKAAETLPQFALESGAIAALAFGDPVAYAAKATDMLIKGHSGMRTLEAPGEYNLTPAMEAFNETELKNYMSMSVVFNIMASRQGEFAECFYPTVVVSPDMPGADVTVRRTMVLNEIQHQLSGVPLELNRRNLIDAVIDPTILSNESNALIPVVVNAPAGNPNINTQYFVAASAVAPYQLATDAGQSVLTAPLAVGMEVDLLGISQRTDIQIQGQYDITDFLDPRVMLTNLYVQFTTSGTTPVTSIVPFNVSRMPRNQWVKSVEGNYKELMLDFRTLTMALQGTTEDVLGTAGGAPALTGLRAAGTSNWIVRLGMRATGYGQVEKGTISVTPGQITVEKIYSTDAYGNQTDITTAINNGTQTNQQWLAAQFTTMAIIGYDVAATRSNLNRRTRGLLLETTDVTERYTVALTAPLTMPAPVGSTRDAADITTLINAARFRNDNLAVTTLLSYKNALSTLMSAPGFSVAVPDIEGMGRYVTRPYYEYQQLDVLASINNIMTKDRLADVQQTIVNQIRDMAYRMYQMSGYQPALDSVTGGSGETPIVIIGTDSFTAKFIQLDGDNRLTGLALESRVVVSLDERMWGQIVIGLTRRNQTGADPLCFGQMFWMPELASTVQVTRNGATIKEPMVQPRMRHVNNLPLMCWINVVNLDQAVTQKVPLNTHSV